MLHASETWPLTKTNLQRNDRVMKCRIKPEDVAMVRSSEPLAKLELPQPHFERKKASLVWACGAF